MERREEPGALTSVAPERRWAADGIWRGIRRTFQDPGDIVLAVRIGLFLMVMPKRLERRPLNELLSEIESSSRVPARDERSGIERISRLRQAWLASPLLRARNTCYVRAVTLYRFLDPAGRVMRIHFGVEPGVSESDRMRGHAWVTLDGDLLEAPEPVLAGRVHELYVYPQSD
jgi:Transglutaminase-like superfamily